MPQRPKVLITGGAGLIGSILIDKLSDQYEFSSFDLKQAAGVPSIVGDLHDFSAVETAIAGHDAVIHLAADTRVEADWESTLKNNFISTYNVFEASKRKGVKRVVFASSQHATGGFYLDEPWKHIVNGDFDKLTHGHYELVDETCRIRPDGYYGASKAYGEALGSYYLDYHQLSSIHVRIGWVMGGNDPTFSPFALSLWLSHRDAAQFFGCCLKTNVPYGVYFATSDNKWKIFDISRARTELGYQPEDGAGQEWTSRR
ncbi:MAG: NAD-dependent epimerase/dehydratase family protein [Candidatus Latescibacteria bacterium]|nr:NAD-dependent epimerase/dehydratase family protein [Candidatus Latescibacterota bacterium]